MIRSLVLGISIAAYGVGASVGTAPRVTATAPRPLANDVAPSTAIEIVFDAPIDPASALGDPARVFGQWSGPATGALAIDPNGTRARFTPDRPFFAGERVTVTVPRSWQGADGVALDQGYEWTFRVRAGAGTLDQIEAWRFSPRDSAEGTIQIYGAYAGDTDRDGWTDLAIVNERAHDIRLYRNDRSGAYTVAGRYALSPATFPSPSAGTDLDRDGDIDLVVGGGAGDLLDVLPGDGAGGFGTRASYRAAQGVRCLAILDADGDGDPDAATANRSADNLTLLLNRGDGSFDEPIVYDFGIDRETACAAADANGDGRTDLFVGALNGQTLTVLVSDGEGGFSRGGEIKAAGRPWMLAAGDVDGDGRADVVSANSRGNTVSVALGDGEGGFASIRHYTGGRRPLAVDLGDLDGDGDLDLVASNYDSADFTVYENDGSGRFELVATLPATSAGSCTVLHDRDNDGDLDITGIDEVDDIIFFFENRPGG